MRTMRIKAEASDSLMEELKSGVTPETVREVAKDEQVDLDLLVQRIISGRVVILRSRNHVHAKPIGVGEGLRTKVNANIGTSVDYRSLDEELEKLRVAIEASADTVMDLSTGGDLDRIRRAIISNSPIPVGTVPIYQAAIEAKDKYGSLVEMTVDHIFEVIEKHAADGVDFITVHCGVTRRALDVLIEQKRIAGIVSRGGAFMAGWMLHNKAENPLYEEFDRLLKIAQNYEVALSLGDGMRPGCIADASDRAQFTELITLGELVRRARQAGVQTMVEGPGHLPFDQIKANVEMEKTICEGAPFYVLGPVVVDVAPGYDHITSAIGGTMAAFAGADFLCYVTPREHLGLPTVEDVREGVIVCRIAAHAADVARGIPGAREWDSRMAEARKRLDWESQIRLSLDPKKTRSAYEERRAGRDDACTMCGEFCAMKLVSEFLGSDKFVKC